MKPKPSARSILLGAALMLFPCALQAQSIKAPSPDHAPAVFSWEDISPYWLKSASPLQIAFRPGAPEWIFVGTNYEALCYSPNAGKTWYHNYIDFYISPGQPSWWIDDIVFNPNAPLEGLAVTMSGTFWSDDGGLHWYPHAQPRPEGSYMAALVPGQDRVVVSDIGHARLWIYEWATHTWTVSTEIPQNPGSFELSFDQSTPPRLYVGTYKGVWWTTDLGGTFHDTYGPVAGPVIHVVADPEIAELVLAAAGSDLYSSLPPGFRKPTWFPKGSGLPGTQIKRLLHDPLNPDRLFLGVQDFGVYVSLDRGDTWKPMTQEGMTFLSVLDLAINPEKPQFLIAACDDGSGLQGGLYRIRIPQE